MPPSRIWGDWAGCESKVPPVDTGAHPGSHDGVEVTSENEQRL